MRRLLKLLDAMLFTLTDKWSSEAHYYMQHGVAYELANGELRAQRGDVAEKRDGQIRIEPLDAFAEWCRKYGTPNEEDLTDMRDWVLARVEAPMKGDKP